MVKNKYLVIGLPASTMNNGSPSVASGSHFMKRNMEERTASKVSLSNDSLRIVTYMVNM
jgi:hypothetical protein